MHHALLLFRGTQAATVEGMKTMDPRRLSKACAVLAMAVGLGTRDLPGNMA